MKKKPSRAPFQVLWATHLYGSSFQRRDANRPRRELLSSHISSAIRTTVAAHRHAAAAEQSVVGCRCSIRQVSAPPEAYGAKPCACVALRVTLTFHCERMEQGAAVPNGRGHTRSADLGHILGISLAICLGVHRHVGACCLHESSALRLDGATVICCDARGPIRPR